MYASNTWAEVSHNRILHWGHVFSVLSIQKDGRGLARLPHGVSEPFERARRMKTLQDQIASDKGCFESITNKVIVTMGIVTGNKEGSKKAVKGIKSAGEK